LDRVPLVPEQSGGIRERFAQLTGFPVWPGPDRDTDPGQRPAGPEAARSALRELVRASTHRYATRAHGDPIMLVHAATAPNAVLRTLPALPG
ncbi:hypothetical protein G3M58_70905, partial [Streptomyces sp. SID7499]|nr:hypothetical protein [Streptomyces sp. SID7499]